MAKLAHRQKPPSRTEEQLLTLQRDILHDVATSNDHDANLTKLCLTAETLLSNAVASIMLLDNRGERLQVRTAPSISPLAIKQLNGLIPGPNAGSCGNAIYRKAAIYVSNTSDDERWSNVRQFTHDFNIQACWSNPIHDPSGEVIGSFALSSFEARKPNSFQKNLLSVCANLAGIIIQREMMEKHLWQKAHFDSLTKLPNRQLLHERLDHAIKKADRHKKKLGLLFIDVDDFKMVNDSFGHIIGDEVLIEIAKVMQKCIRDEDTLARTGGDEFVILLEDFNDSLGTSIVAQKILDQVKSIKHDNHIHTTLSIGISIYPDDATDIQSLMRDSDTAMYAAKTAGKNNFFFYKPELTNSIQHKVTIDHELRDAIKKNQFVLHFQPIFDLTGTNIQSIEALIRWNHPNKGLLAPSHFISFAEKCGLIDKITQWVIKDACISAKQWLDNGLNFERISINLSAIELKRDYHRIVCSILKETHLPPEFLELEITESTLMEYDIDIIKELQALQNYGISIALDDFGSGYSSLNQLRKLPIDKLKIDREFIADIPQNSEDLALVRLIIAMGKSLSLQVVGEGIETKCQFNSLAQEGCDLFQGFYLEKPISEPLLWQH